MLRSAASAVRLRSHSSPSSAQHVRHSPCVRLGGAGHSKRHVSAGVQGPERSGSNGTQWQEGFILDNPFLNSTLQVLDTKGNAVPVRELGGGRTVLGLLRHLGCEAVAQNLLQLRPQFEAHGYKLAVVAIGSPEGGRQMCASLPFPEELLFLDPERVMYRELQLNAGAKYFFSRETLAGVMSLNQGTMQQVLKRYAFIKPPNTESTLQLGGLYVVDGPQLLYAHVELGLAAHAPNEQLLAACCSS